MKLIKFKWYEWNELAKKHNNRLLKKWVLDNSEREYLSAVIKPFRDNVEYITKFKDRVLNEEFIGITCKGAHDFIAFPNFKCDTMYKGMERDKNYTLEELGL